ncbi:MAG TPA: hypothetical protein VHJ20_11045 [Polyangia bacterium]|nr:hypothetical protein [Polyangia bacterium]
MLNKVTPRTVILVKELGSLAEQIDDDLLSGASVYARDEWEALRGRWPSASQIAAGAVDLSDDELEVMIGKVRRFRAILEGFRRHALPAYGVWLPAAEVFQAA